MASGQREGGLDGKLSQTQGDIAGGMAHLGKLMSNSGSMTKIYNSKFAPAGKMKPTGKMGKQ